MPRSMLVTRAAWVAATSLALAACRTSSDAKPDPGPSLVPPAAAAAPPGTLDADDVKDQRVTRAEELLVGRFAGVEVIPMAGGGVSVRIRGQTSIALNTEPLYVIDGMPINAEPGGALKWLDPHEIQRIEVLKDIGATAFYGIRGANGVILITTKH